MKRKTMKLTSLLLSMLLVLAPQTAMASKKEPPRTLEEKIQRYEAVSPHYRFDEAAEITSKPDRKARFTRKDGIYMNPDASVTNAATLMITGDLMCQWRQQEAAFKSDGSDFIDIEDMKVIKAEAQQKLNQYRQELLESSQQNLQQDSAQDSSRQVPEVLAEAQSDSTEDEDIMESGSEEDEMVPAVPAVPGASSLSIPALDFGVIAQPAGQWDFDESFQYVRKILRRGDLVIGNLETMLSQSSPLTMQCRTLESKPYLNSPVEFLDAIDYAGYDLLTLANNHNCDVGVRGLLETLENIDNYHFMRTGMFASEEEDRYLIVDVNGIKIGIVAYAAYFNTKDDNFTDEGQEVLLNRFFTDKARTDIRAAKKAGAEFVIAFMHWGKENTHETTYTQERYAYNVAKAGADYIVGSHPHALQPYDIIEVPGGREVPVIYSMGNFLSCMGKDINNDTQILQLNLVKDDSGQVSVTSHRLYPCTIMPDLEITSSSGSVRTDSYVVTPHSEKYGPGLSLSGKSSASRDDIQYLSDSLTRIMEVNGGRMILDLPYDPYGLTWEIDSEDQKIQIQDYVLGRFQWVLANRTV